MKTVHFCAVVIFGVMVYSDGTRFRCDYQYFRIPDAYLKYHEMPSNWHEAQLRCHFEGAILATPITAALRESMITLANRSSGNGVFTGIHTKFSRGDYFSIEGIHISNIPHTWTQGEPNNRGNNEGCIIMLLDGSFADASCEKPMPYICYKKAVPGLIMNACGTTDNDYQLDPRTGKCYKFHQYPRYWSRAYMTCAAEGAHLAIINNETEAQVIRELWSRYPSINGVGDYVTTAAHVGFHDWDEHGEWRTIHGQTLVEAGYSKFQGGEPNNASSQFCGAVFRNGLFDDMWCYKRAPFICEKDPTSLTCPEDQNVE